MSFLYSLIVALTVHQYLPMGGVPTGSSCSVTTPTFVAAAATAASGGTTGGLTVNYTVSGACHSLFYIASTGSGSITSVTDSAASLTALDSVTWDSTLGVYKTFWASGVTSGAHTITATFGASSVDAGIYIFDISHSTHVGNRVTSNNGTSNANPIPCGSITTSANSLLLLFGSMFDGGQTLTVGSGPPALTFPSISGTPLGHDGMEYSTSATTATTYTVASGFVPSVTGQAFVCYALEAQP